VPLAEEIRKQYFNLVEWNFETFLWKRSCSGLEFFDFGIENIVFTEHRKIHGIYLKNVSFTVPEFYHWMNRNVLKFLRLPLAFLTEWQAWIHLIWNGQDPTLPGIARIHLTWHGQDPPHLKWSGSTSLDMVRIHLTRHGQDPPHSTWSGSTSLEMIRIHLTWHGQDPPHLTWTGSTSLDMVRIHST
jgi:hypothetical protein